MLAPGSSHWPDWLTVWRLRGSDLGLLFSSASHLINYHLCAHVISWVSVHSWTCVLMWSWVHNVLQMYLKAEHSGACHYMVSHLSAIHFICLLIFHSWNQTSSLCMGNSVWLGCPHSDAASLNVLVLNERVCDEFKTIGWLAQCWDVPPLPVALIKWSEVSIGGFYLRQRGCIFTSVRFYVYLIVSKITQKQLNRFPPNLVIGCRMCQGRNHSILM